MKYEIIGPRGKGRGQLTRKTIYVLPVSPDSGEYLMLYPKIPDKEIRQALRGNELQIDGFAGMGPEVIDILKNKLKQSIWKYFERSIRKASNLFIGGVVVLVLGILNWALPDPLPLVDELAFSLTGIILLTLGQKRRGEALAENEDVSIIFDKRIMDIPIIKNPLLSNIYESIRIKDRPVEGSGLKDTDLIEREAEWLLKYLDAEQMVKNGEATLSQVREIKGVIDSALPIRDLAAVERKRDKSTSLKKSGRLAGRARLISEETFKKHGITGTVLEIYRELYKSIESFLNSVP
jgi:hypothetical protein